MVKEVSRPTVKLPLEVDDWHLAHAVQNSSAAPEASVSNLPLDNTLFNFNKFKFKF